MHHQPTTQTTLFHLLLPALHPALYPPTASVILLPPLDTPQHHPSQPSRTLVPHSSLFIHPSCTPPPLPSPLANQPPVHPPAATLAASPQNSFACRRHHHRHQFSFSLALSVSPSLYSPPRRHAGSTKRDCCYVALGDQQVSPSSSSSSSKTKAAHHRSLARFHVAFSPLIARPPPCPSFSGQTTSRQMETRRY